MPVLTLFMIGYFLISMLFLHYYAVFDKRKELTVAVFGGVGSLLIYSSTHSDTLLIEGFRALIAAASFDWLFFLLVPAISFYSLLILIYVVLNIRINFGFIKFFLFSIVLFGLFLYGMVDLEFKILDMQINIILLNIIGLLYIVFVSACHVVFSKIILIVDFTGVVLSLYFGNVIFYHEYFVILDMIPGFGDSRDIFIVAASILLAGYAFGVDRGWFPAYPASFS